MDTGHARLIVVGDRLHAVLSGPTELDVVNGNVAISAAADVKLRELLSIPAPHPTLTPEQVAIAEAEAELREAMNHGITYVDTAFYPDGHGRYCIQYDAKQFPGNDEYGCEHIPAFGQPLLSRLSAAQAAVARVAELRAEAERKRLPEPEHMDMEAISNELEKRGWKLKASRGFVMDAVSMTVPAWDNGDRMLHWRPNEDLVIFYARTLTYARELDAQK